jgi:hypothetical protein
MLNLPEVVENQEQSSNSSRSDLGNISRGNELQRSDTDSGKEFTNKLQKSAEVGLSD